MRIKPALVLFASATMGASAQVPPNPSLVNQQAQIQMLQSQFIAQNQTMLASQAAMLQARSAGMSYGALANETAILRMQGMNQASQETFMLNMNLQARVNNQAALLRVVLGSRAALLRAAAGAQPALPQAPGPVIMRPTFGNPLAVAKPTLSQSSGTLVAGSRVKLSTDTHYSTLYYTTDGWTPTTQSQRYLGPIEINHTTHLRVMAQGPNFMRSAVVEADYTVKGDSPEPIAPLLVPADGILRQGTPIRLVTSAQVTSDTAQVGDKMPLVLDQDIKLGDTVLAAKGATIDAIITIADPKGGSGGPGDIVFEVQSVDLGGKKLPLYATETMEGTTGLLFSAKEAVIKPGMSVTALVLADTAVKP
jgi:hypothetical protein